MTKEFGPKGIHVGYVVVDGAIAGEKILNRIPNFEEKIDQGQLINLEGIFDGYVFLYKQSAQAWTFELDLRISKEKW
jgi:hypothetical protein